MNIELYFLFHSGPYGGPRYHDFARSQGVLLVAGGSGITFALAILEDLIGAALQGNSNIQNVLLVWSVREKGNYYTDFHFF